VSTPEALPTPAFIRELPLPGLTAGPGISLDFRIGLAPQGPGVRRGPWWLLVLFAPLLLPLAVAILLAAIGLIVVMLAAAPFVPAARRKIRSVRFGRRHPVEVELDRHPLVPGESAIACVRHPRGGRPAAMRVLLVQREQVRWRVGTDTRTETRVVQESLLAELDGDAVEREVRIDFVVPETAMHSFEAPNNAVRWAIDVRRDIAGGGTHEEEAVFQVLPLGVVEGVLEARAAGGAA
jgi:hypothetical protein